MKRSKKGTIPWIRKKIDKEISLLVREKGFCEARDFSSCGGVLQHDHVLPRRAYPNLRYDILNALSLCWKHHLFFKHRTPLEFTWWFQNKYPQRYEYLQLVRYKYKKFTYKDYEKIRESVKNKDLKALIMFPA